jgi:hypothetical protein
MLYWWECVCNRKEITCSDLLTIVIDQYIKVIQHAYFIMFSSVIHDW